MFTQQTYSPKRLSAYCEVRLAIGFCLSERLDFPKNSTSYHSKSDSGGGS